MSAPTTIQVADTAEYTLFRDTYAEGATVLRYVMKAGTAGYNFEQLQQKMAGALDQLETADANWATLTTAQKDSAQRLAIRVSAKLARLVLGRLDGN